MQTLSEIKQLLADRGLSPRKALGQNFLVDHNLIRKLVEASAVREGDLVLEVGPGTGALTDELLSRGCAVVASELDRGLAALLRDRYAALPGRFTLVEGDCLENKRELSRDVKAALGARPFRLVANLPYGAATPLMMTLLTDHPECASLHVTIQREVADRLLAGPGSRDYGPLGVVARAVGDATRIATLPPECFWPRPDVTSAMVSVTRRERPLVENVRALADFTQHLFSHRRKQIGSSLKALLPRGGSWPAGITPSMRAEDLSVDQIIALSRAAAAR